MLRQYTSVYSTAILYKHRTTIFFLGGAVINRMNIKVYTGGLNRFGKSEGMEFELVSGL
jgi:hypothetical protein